MFYTTLAAIVVAMILFAWLGLRARLADGGLDDYVTARNRQGARALGLSFLASGMGGWILFAPPEVGALVGPLALAGQGEIRWTSQFRSKPRSGVLFI